MSFLAAAPGRGLVVDLGGQVYNAKASGVAGDGVTDDTANLQAAVNQANSLGVPLYVPAGTYLLTAPIQLPAVSGFRLVGAGKGLTVFRAHDTLFSWGSAAGVNGVINVPAGSSNTYLGHFRVYGGNTNRASSQYSGLTNGYAAGLFVSSQWALVEHVEVWGFSAAGFGSENLLGVHISGCQQVAFVGCFFAQNGISIGFRNNNSLVAFYRCDTQSSGLYTPATFAHVDVQGTTSDVLFSNCLIDEAIIGSGTNPSFWVESGATAARVVLEGCTVYIASSQPGVLLAGTGSDVTLRSCRLVPFGPNTNCTAVNVASGSTVRVMESVVTANGTGSASTGAGVFQYTTTSTITGTKGATTNTQLY